jgi:hypothetical protein
MFLNALNLEVRNYVAMLLHKHVTYFKRLDLQSLFYLQLSYLELRCISLVASDFRMQSFDSVHTEPTPNSM